MKNKLLWLFLLASSSAMADQVKVSTFLLDGTYVGESKYYYDTPYSDKPGFYHEENSIEHGLAIEYIYNINDDWDITAKFSIADSDLRSAKTYEGGVVYHLDSDHSFGVRYKGTDAKEEYQLDTRLIDPEHQNSVTNGEYAEWVIGRYQYNFDWLEHDFYVGVEGAIELNDDDALVEDDFSGVIGYDSDLIISEFKMGDDLIFFNIGLKFDI